LFGKSGPAAIDKETKTLKAALLSIQEEGSRAATGHQDFANKILNDIVKPLDNYDKAKQNERKKISTDGQKRVKAFQEAKQAADKAKQNYTGVSKEAEAATEAHEKAKKDLAADSGNKKHQEAEKRAGQKAGPLNEKAKAAEAAYQKAVDAANELTEKTYGEYLPPLLDALQGLEEERYNTLKTALQDYVSAQRAVPTNLEERVQDIDKQVSAIDIEADLTEFIGGNKSATTEPEKLKFVPFKEPAGGPSSSASETPAPAAVQKEKEKEVVETKVETPAAPVAPLAAEEPKAEAKSEDDIF